MTDRYPAGSYSYAIEKVLTERRKAKLDKKPLLLKEFLGPLAAGGYVDDDENKNFLKFTDEICLYKKKYKLKYPEDDDKKAKKGKKK